MQPVHLNTDMAPAASICRVRFDTECVLIPEPVSPSRMPRLLIKSYSLPLWRKKPPASVADEQPSTSPTDARFRFSRPSSNSPSTSRVRSVSRDPNDPNRPPLVPCIVDHEHPHPRHIRRPSLPLAPRLDVVTVPLRDCCISCHPVTEESLSEGSAWQEKFSKGARRRRNSSADSYPVNQRRVNEDLPGFESVLNVDEVAKRRRTRDVESHMPVNQVTLNDPEENSGLDLLPSLTRQKLHISTNPLSSQSPPSLVEADQEDQLFPLPSPRRTPNGSPLPSPLPTPSSSTTNLAKTRLGQKSSQTATASGTIGFGPPATLTTTRGKDSTRALLTVPNLGRADPARETRGRFEVVDVGEYVPELTHSPSSSPFPSPDISLLSSSPLPLPPTPVTHAPIPVYKRDASPPPPYTSYPTIASPSVSPQLGRRERGASVSGMGNSWRKLHLAGSLLRAGADVLKGVNSMSGGVAV